MQRLRFINEDARTHEVRVAAVNEGEPLTYNEVYEVSNELAERLLKNQADWRLLSPPPVPSVESAQEEQANE